MEKEHVKASTFQGLDYMAQYLDEACVNSRFFMLSNDVLVIDEKYYETQEVWYDEKSRI